LEAFEAVARLGHVTRAAEELGRTQSAISRQIANLEAFARRPLFDRKHKHLVLNEAGKNFHEAVCRILNDLEVESARLLTYGRDDRLLRLGVLPAFGSRWLMPHLAGFVENYSHVELHVVKGLGPEEFDRLQVDAAIECSEKPRPELHCEHLIDEEIVAVAAPQYYEGFSNGHFSKVHMPSRPEGWIKWMDARGAPRTGPDMKFEKYSMMSEAACLGLGVAVIPTLYINKELSDGQLIAPFGDPIASGRSYWLTFPHNSRQKQKVKDFSAWLFSRLK
jgi:DNA-binding transcriptional LysR family regulator